MSAEASAGYPHHPDRHVGDNFDLRLWGHCSRGERLKTIIFVAALRSSVATCKASRGPGGNVTEFSRARS